MALIGYARVSSTDQSVDLQCDQLRDAGCERIFSEQRSGTTRQGRTALAECLEFIREGDTLVVCRLDRLARSLPDLIDIIRGADAKGVTFRCLHQAVDTTTSEGRLMLSMLGAFAEFESDIRRERQREGIEKARLEGKKIGGRKRRVTREQVANLKTQGKGASEIARLLNCDRTAVYRAHPDGWGPAPIAGAAA